MTAKRAVEAMGCRRGRRLSWRVRTKVEEDEGEGEDQADEAFGQEIEGEGCGEGEAGEKVGRMGLLVNVPGGGAVEGDEEEVNAEGHPKGDEDVRDKEAGVQVWADGSCEGES